MGFRDSSKKYPAKQRSEGSGFKKSSDGGSRPSNNRTLTKASCASCGQSCQVPFRPTAGKPVYCNDCFRKNDSDSRPGRPTHSKGRPDSNRQHHGSENRSSSPGLSEVNAKLDRIINLLESKQS